MIMFVSMVSRTTRTTTKRENKPSFARVRLSWKNVKLVEKARIPKGWSHTSIVIAVAIMISTTLLDIDHN